MGNEITDYKATLLSAEWNSLESIYAVKYALVFRNTINPLDKNEYSFVVETTVSDERIEDGEWGHLNDPRPLKSDQFPIQQHEFFVNEIAGFMDDLSRAELPN